MVAYFQMRYGRRYEIEAGSKKGCSRCKSFLTYRLHGNFAVLYVKRISCKWKRLLVSFSTLPRDIYMIFQIHKRCQIKSFGIFGDVL